MSKASEWVKVRPDDCMHNDFTVAGVDEDGWCRINGSDDGKVLMSETRALILADWIRATFGEGPSA